jgi:O-antigen/teichoic acid export membrane protein
MKPEKKIFLNTSYQIIGKIITSILGVISFGLLAHYLNPLQMGQYNLILSFTGFLVMFADFGLVTLLIRDLSNKTADEAFTSHTFSLRLVLSLISMSAGSILVFFFPYPLIVKVGVILYAFCNIFYLLSSIIGAVFQSRLQFEKIVIPQIVSSIITTALIAYAVWSKLSFLSFIAIAGSGFLINFLVSL